MDANSARGAESWIWFLLGTACILTHFCAMPRKEEHDFQVQDENRMREQSTMPRFAPRASHEISRMEDVDGRFSPQRDKTGSV